MTDSDIQAAILDMGRKARAASRELVKLSSEQKNAILRAMADGLEAAESTILEANAKDLANAESNGLSKAMIDRLMLNPKRLSAIAQAVREVADLPDPVGEELTEWTRPNGLRILKKRVPIGVIGIIFESRPNVTTDAASLVERARVDTSAICPTLRRSPASKVSRMRCRCSSPSAEKTAEMSLQAAGMARE